MTDEPKPETPKEVSALLGWVNKNLVALIGVGLLGFIVYQNSAKIADAPTVLTPVVTPQPVVEEPAKPFVAEMYIVTNDKGERVTKPVIEQYAKELQVGVWFAQGIPKPGEVGKTFEIRIVELNAPRPPPDKPVVVTPDKPVDPTVPPPPTVKVDRVTYVYEKDDGMPPPGVAAGLNKLNRQNITATVFEEDTTDGTGQTPEQYKTALEAAKKNGLPALVVQSGNVVKSAVKVTTEQQVLEAVK
jgi:hypothetical protein